jgi:hypothetical protein
MAKISIVTAGHVSMNPRVWREADALANAGHAVTVIGVSFDRWQAEMDAQMLQSRLWNYRAAADLRGLSLRSRFRWQWARLRFRLGKMNLRRGWWSDPHALGYSTGALLHAARDEKADLTLLHLEAALWVGTCLRREGFRIGVDVEDWYSEDRLPQSSENEIQFLRRLEREVLHRAAHTTTTSQAMASALSSAFEVPPPEIIYNSDPSTPNVYPVPQVGPLRLLWFSQTVGRGRGLEDLFMVLPLLQGDWSLEIRGRCSSEMRAWLENQIPSVLRERVRIEPPVPPNLLGELISRNEVGLALDFPWCRNKDLTISNKIIQYLQAGLTVVAASTAGAREVKSAMPEAVSLYVAGECRELAGILNTLIKNRTAMISGRASIHQRASATFGYEHQSKRLVASIERALQGSRQKSDRV